MLKVTLTTAIGKQYLLTGAPVESPVLAPEAALVELISAASRSDQVVPSRAGVLAGRTRWGAIDQSIDFYLHADSGEGLDALDAEFRRGLHVWAPDRVVRPKPATLKIETNNPNSPMYLEVWLSRPLPGAVVDPSKRTAETITATLFNPNGLFRAETQKGTGTVRVVNPGDEIVYPRLEGIGSGGVVKGPSGATWPWPNTGKPVAVNLDSQALRLAGAFPEGVPPGGTGTYTLPAGVTLSYAPMFASPW